LIMPFQLARVGVERDHRRGVEIVARPRVAVPIGPRVADAPVGQVRVRIVRTGDPNRSAAGLPGVAAPTFATRLAGSGNRVEAPRLPAGLDVVRRQETADALSPARGPDE